MTIPLSLFLSRELHESARGRREEKMNSATEFCHSRIRRVSAPTKRVSSVKYDLVLGDLASHHREQWYQISQLSACEKVCRARYRLQQIFYFTHSPRPARVGRCSGVCGAGRFRRGAGAAPPLTREYTPSSAGGISRFMYAMACVFSYVTRIADR